VWSLLGVLILSPRLLFYFVVFLFALADDAEYGPPIASLGVLFFALFVGSLAGGVGGLVGGTLFTRVSGVQAEERE
jgi:hypothetical protein